MDWIEFKIFIFHSGLTLACWRELRMYWLPPLQRVRSPSQKVGVLGVALNWIWCWDSSSGESEVPFYCHYSQVHSNLEWQYLLGSRLWVKLVYLKIICIKLEYLIAYNCKLFVVRKLLWSCNCLPRIIIINYLWRCPWCKKQVPMV